MEDEKEKEIPELGQPRSLQSLLKDKKCQEEIARRFKISREKYMAAQTKIAKDDQENEFGGGKSIISAMMKNFE